MSELTPEIAADVIAACQAGAEEAAGALTRALDTEIELSVGEAATLDPESPPDGLDGPGLAILMTFGETASVALLPESSGLLPDWIAAPDATGESKLSTLAQELSMLLMPETLMANAFEAARVENLGEALARAEAAESAGLAPLTLTAGDKTGQLSLVWPCAAPAALFPATEEAEEAEEEADTAAEDGAPAGTGGGPAQIRGPRPTDYSQLPPYSRSLLRVEVPVTVCLAAKKLPIGDITDLGPGAIITFDKPCDDLLQLTVGDVPVATGEAVKVGEKFGLRVQEMILPDEQFKTLRRTAG